MPEPNWNFMLFYVIFLSQVLLISFYLPRQVLSRVRHVVDTYPPSTHPKLYPVPIDTVEKALRTYRNLNTVALLAGFALVLIGVSSPSEEMLNWDSQSVLLIYFFLQISPLIFGARTGVKYFRLMRNTRSRTTRTAELHPRRLFDFVSPTFVGVAILTYITLLLLILYIRQNPFPGFAGYVNIFAVTALNMALAAIGYAAILAPRRDPHQAYEDRLRQIELVVKTIVLTSIVANTFLAMTFVLPALGLRDFTDMFSMLYYQLCAVISFRAFRIDNMSLEVYKEDLAVA